MTRIRTVVVLGMICAASCSRAHEANDGSEPSTPDTGSTDTPECDRVCQPACVDHSLVCRCHSDPDGEGCEGWVVHCPTGLAPPECGPAGYGVDCSFSTRPGGGGESAICVPDTARGRGEERCVPACPDSEHIGCYDSSGLGAEPCEAFVVECPTAGHAPVCNDYSVECTLPDGTLEKPICVPG